MFSHVGSTTCGVTVFMVSHRHRKHLFKRHHVNVLFLFEGLLSGENALLAMAAAELYRGMMICHHFGFLIQAKIFHQLQGYVQSPDFSWSATSRSRFSLHFTSHLKLDGWIYICTWANSLQHSCILQVLLSAYYVFFSIFAQDFCSGRAHRAFRGMKPCEYLVPLQLQDIYAGAICGKNCWMISQQVWSLSSVQYKCRVRPTKSSKVQQTAIVYSDLLQGTVSLPSHCSGFKLRYHVHQCAHSKANWGLQYTCVIALLFPMILLVCLAHADINPPCMYINKESYREYIALNKR